jgi:site-specific recombinase XerD
MTTATLPALIQQFFTDRLSAQMEASPNTIASYRDSFRLLLRFASEQTGRAPTKLRIEDIDAASSWIVRRWICCSPHLIDPPGLGVVTTQSSSSHFKQDCGQPS